MNLKLLGAILIPLSQLVFHASAKADEAYVNCVQNELSAMGVSGIPMTGKINSATKTAIEVLRGQYASVAAIAVLPRLSEQSAVSWCREIAALKPALRGHMPGSGAPLVLGPGGEESLQTSMLRRTFHEVEQFFNTQYRIYPASRVDVAGSASGETLAQYAIALQRKRGRSIGRMDNHVSEICDTPSIRYGGQAYRNQLLICWPHAARYDAAWQKKVTPVVSAVMAHEYMHHVQRELANDKVSSSGYRSRSKRGPAWMVEGSAELAEYRWRGKRYGVRKSLQALQEPARESSKGLRGMQSHGAVKGRDQYKIAMFAVYLLAERFGEDKVLDYWRYIGQGKSWEAAFKASFGLSLGDYMTRFETLRADPAAAAAFIAAG